MARFSTIPGSVCAAGLLVLSGACGQASLGSAPPDAAVAEDPGTGPGAILDAAPATDGAPGADAALTVDAAPRIDPVPCVEGDARAVDPATGTCYLFFSDAITWDTAADVCAAIGAHLATSTSIEENMFIQSVAPAGVVDVWLGGSDILNELDWLWITGEPMIFEGWRDGEPNDGGTNGEDCMIMEVDNGGTWDDRSCDLQLFPYFCERPETFDS